MAGGETIALTGGSGFIGRSFASHARAADVRIRQLGRRPPVDPRDEWVPFDLDAPGLDPDALAGCRTLVHLAGYIPARHDAIEEAERCLWTNALGTASLIDLAARQGVDHVIQTSSANAYAPGAASPNEGAALFPHSRRFYLGSKILQEIYATDVCCRAGLSLTTLRLGSVYGPGQAMGAVGAMAQAARLGDPIRVADAGRFGADLVHVDDVAALMTSCLARRLSETINVGSGERTTLATVAAILARMTGTPILIEPLSSAGGDHGFPALDITRARALGYAPMPLATGLATMLDLANGRDDS
uniref:NAD-dependent epimerase/dehydratase family protein n=1 Tax=uncultured Sphingomonas sp. TaxID=158754 RepID=UPI0035CAE6D6